MLRDNKNDVAHLNLVDRWRRLGIPEWAAKSRKSWRDLGLPSKLLMLTAVFVMLAEVLIFLPSISTFRAFFSSSRFLITQVEPRAGGFAAAPSAPLSVNRVLSVRHDVAAPPSLVQ